MFWKWGLLRPRLKSIPNKQIIKDADSFKFLMPVSSRCKTQKTTVGTWMFVSGKHECLKPGTNLQKPIFRSSDLGRARFSD